MTENRPDRRDLIVAATLYVTSRFYPPLPAAYGELAVTAVDRVNSGDDTPIDVTDVNPRPRQYWTGGDGRAYVEPAALVDALRLHHTIDTDDED